MKKIILASKSPRRKALIEKLNWSFELRHQEVDESFPSDLPPNETAKFLAKKKASAYVQSLSENEVLISADTVVVFQDKILGKPKDEAEARNILLSLSDNSHEVITGVCLASKHELLAFDEVTKVFFKKLSNEEIDFYIKNHKPYDKAGAYGIQEWIGMIAVEKIEGCFYNVMGLPVSRLYKEMQKF